MTVRELVNNLQLEGDEIALRVWDDGHDDLLCEFVWFYELTNGEPGEESLSAIPWYDALDTEVQYIFPETEKDGMGYDVRRIVIESRYAE